MGSGTLAAPFRQNPAQKNCRCLRFCRFLPGGRLRTRHMCRLEPGYALGLCRILCGLHIVLRLGVPKFLIFSVPGRQVIMSALLHQSALGRARSFCFLLVMKGKCGKI